MKLAVVTTLALALSANNNCNAFSTSRNARNAGVALKAVNNDNAENDYDAGVMSRRTAAASIFSLIAVAAPMAAQADTSLDFALPSYDTKMSGFGEGNEVFVKKGNVILKEGATSNALMIDPGSDEKEKQLSSMRKAEEARKEALTKKKAEQKEREDETKRRAKEKKARDAERLKNIWSS